MSGKGKTKNPVNTTAIFSWNLSYWVTHWCFWPAFSYLFTPFQMISWWWWWWYFQTATKGFSLNFICTYASTFNPHGSLSSTEDFYTKTEELQKVKVKTTHWSSTIKNSEFCIPTKNAKSLTSGQEPLTPPKFQNAKSQSWCCRNWPPPTTTPPTPRAPPAGLFASSPAPWPRSLSSGGTSILVIDNTIRPLPDHVENLGRQLTIKEKL